MYISNMELIKQKLASEGRMSTSDVIKQILKDDEANPAKKYMRVGERYYNGEHDIFEHDFRQKTVYEDYDSANGFNSHGTTIVNENNSNHHNVHNFHGQQVDQKTAYIIGKPLSVTVEGAEDNGDLKSFENQITSITSDEEFTDTLNDYITSASNKGAEWLHVYYNEQGELKYVIIPAEEVIPFYDTAYQKSLLSLSDIILLQLFQTAKNSSESALNGGRKMMFRTMKKLKAENLS